jgi:hypothetical protein
MSQAVEPSFNYFIQVLGKPPAGLPADATDIYTRAMTLVLSAKCLISAPGGGVCSPGESAKWTDGGVAAQYEALKQFWDGLADLLAARETELRAEAMDVYTVCERILDAFRPLMVLLEYDVFRQRIPVACPPDPGLMALRQTWCGPTTRDPLELAQDLRSGCSALAELRTALSVWANKRGSAGAYTPADSPSRWAKLFGVSPDTFKRRCKENKIRHRKFSSKSYQVLIADLPARHQAKFCAGEAPPAK